MSDPTPTSPRPGGRREWVRLLKRLNIRPSKGMGQNFLVERGIVERIVKHAKIEPTDHVIEVGPGLGILTEELALRSTAMTAIELDHELALYLPTVFRDLPNVRFIEANALDVRIEEIVPAGQPYVLAANLPYSLAAAVIRHFFEQSYPPRRMTVMIQREVAERIVATPPDMSILAIACQLYAVPAIAFHVSPDVFEPSPKVESSLIVFETRPTIAVPPEERPAFFKLVNSGFRQKRKQLANSMADELDLPKADVSVLLARAGVDPSRRAQTLSLDDWVGVAKLWPLLGAPDAP